MAMKNLGRKADFTPEGEEPQMTFPSLWLDKSQTDALGLEDARVGDEMVMEAVVRVTSMSEDEQMDGDRERRVTIDVRRADLSPRQSTDSEKAERIFRSD